MTTFHDPQPQSRRAVRQNERAETTDSTETTDSGFVPFPPNQGTPSYYSDPNGARDMWDTTSRRAAQLPPAAPRPDAPAASGRRAATPPPAAAEPLTYATQSRPPVPSYDGPDFRAQPTPEPVQNDLPPTQALPRQDQPQYRVRDFSPEGRRTAPPAWSAPVEPASDLEYHTEARVATPAPVEPQQDHTLTRREMRALEVEREVPVQPAAAVQPAPRVDAPADTSVPAPFFPFAQQPEPATIVPPVAEPPVAPVFEAPPAHFVQPPVFDAPQQQASEAPAAKEPAELSPFDALFRTPVAEPVQPQQVLPATPPEPAANTALTNAITEFDALANPQPPAPAQPAEPTAWTPPPGHWATQLDADDDPFENTLSRTIGSGHTATSALVLPGMPKDNDIRGPLTSTGEVMLTGSIDLPRSLSSTGTTETMEQDGIDALFDVNDSEINSTDSSPVRAIRAVSTHNSGHGVTHTQKPKGSKALTVLLIAASGMAVVVAGLLITAFAFNVF